MPAASPLRINKRPNAWMKPIPAIAWLTTSAIMAAPHDLLDLPRAAGGRKAFAALDLGVESCRRAGAGRRDRQPGEHMNKPLHIQLPADSVGEGTRG
jgi:hypothetical protein